ncbi:hypothetical protein [Spirosoma linguale]|uniref:Uncharacterized protein n=1 Tax=Spirosoma linguale (strain ATCC 33905 / DSM 74 / LMG 10896 / Claus 1) TaxID=504472 RepID=D2QHL0_SPILD|nr:hypothetical protein Slin_2654 [Spirosoma linguale DSM 74]
MARFIEVTVSARKTLFDAEHIASVMDMAAGCCVYIVGISQPFSVTESYQEIVNALKKAPDIAGFVHSIIDPNKPVTPAVNFGF